MRAAIYARFSSDRQDERSIEDQARLCRELAERLGAAVGDTYADYGISGAHLASRPQALRLIADLRAKRFDLVLAEALDRISRDQEDTAHLWKRVTFAGAKLVTVAEGEISELHVGLKGTMNALFLKDLAQKVRRGQRGRIAQKRAAGGLSYGYKVVRELDGRGELVRGLRAIDEPQAAVVRRIFERYVAGESARAIAAALNAEGVTAPFGGRWNASTINGHAQRGNGILSNQLYVGRLIYNRVGMVKDPETGRRVSRLNSPKDWVIENVPDLRIVEDALWEAAQARKRAIAGAPLSQRRRPPHLLSGLVRCGDCGGPLVIHDRDRLACSRHREQGTCANGRTIARVALERRVLEGLKAKLLSPAAVRAALETYHAERQRLAGDRATRRRALGRQLARIKAEIEKLVDRICAGTATPASDARLLALDGAGGEREHLERELNGIEAADRIVDLHPGAIDAYTAAITHLEATLAGDRPALADAIATLRQLVDRIEVTPLGPGRADGFSVIAFGRLAAVLELPQRNAARTLCGIPVVAGEGLEPPTLGL